MLPSSQWTDYNDADIDRAEERASASASSGKVRTDAKTMTPGTRRWLSINAACKMLGIDHSTMRRWSDSGKIPVFRTPGGHRRYSEEDLRAFLRGEERSSARVSRRELTRLALVQYDQQMQRVHAHPWMRVFGPKADSEMRELGRRLVDLSVRYISGRGSHDALLAESRVVARRHGQQSAMAGLSSAEALETLLFVRRPVFRSVCQYIERQRIACERSCQLMDELVEYMDEIMRVAIRAHEDAERAWR